MVKRARLNRNSFYYHYANLGDLAEDAVNKLLDNDLPRLLMDGFEINAEQFYATIEHLLNDGRIAKVITVAGPHSTNELRSILKDAIFTAWLKAAEIQKEDLSKEAILSIRFILGGMLAVYGNANPHDPAHTLNIAKRLPIRDAATSELTRIFHEAKQK